MYVFHRHYFCDSKLSVHLSKLTGFMSLLGGEIGGTSGVAGVWWPLLVITSAQWWMAWCILGPSDVWKMKVLTPVGVRLKECVKIQTWTKLKRRHSTTVGRYPEHVKHLRNNLFLVPEIQYCIMSFTYT